MASLEAAQAAHTALPARFARYVAIGDSSTEGLMDHDGRGGFRGWSARLAERIDAAQIDVTQIDASQIDATQIHASQSDVTQDHAAQRDGPDAAARAPLRYANLAVRGLTTREIHDQQLARALAMEPDLATLFCGTNDVLQPRFDIQAFTADVHAMQAALRARGATVLTFTLPDLTPLLPLARLIAPRIELMNAAVRAVCGLTGTRLVDFAQHPVTTDARLWNRDRIHANSAGHARIADALAEALALPGSDGAWRVALPRRADLPLAGVARELYWGVRYLLPWSVLALLPRRPGAPQPGKRPELLPLAPATGD